jgi:hypothetical protein
MLEVTEDLIFTHKTGKYQAAPAGWHGHITDPIMTWDHAITAASKYVGASYHKWYLPDLGVLNSMYEQLHKNDIGDFCDQAYWSSEIDPVSQDGWCQYFDYGIQYNNSKKLEHYVRPVRII